MPKRKGKRGEVEAAMGKLSGAPAPHAMGADSACRMASIRQDAFGKHPELLS
jgi:hypothetical protein